MVSPTFPARLDVMNLQTIRRIAQSAPESIPFVYRPPGLVVDAGTHIPFHVFVPSFLPPSCGTKGHHGKARAGASPLCITLAAVIYWECARGHDRALPLSLSLPGALSMHHEFCLKDTKFR